MVGNAGLGKALIIIGLANAISVLTSISLSAIETNLKVKVGAPIMSSKIQIKAFLQKIRASLRNRPVQKKRKVRIMRISQINRYNTRPLLITLHYLVFCHLDNSFIVLSSDFPDDLHLLSDESL